VFGTLAETRNTTGDWLTCRGPAKGPMKKIPNKPPRPARGKISKIPELKDGVFGPNELTPNSKRRWRLVLEVLVHPRAKSGPLRQWQQVTQTATLTHGHECGRGANAL